MFIVCPSCSGPYRIQADQIAPLVQVACPHCEYRVILDFEAANDPALREPGHQFAQGFENAEAYFSVYSHVTKNPDARPGVNPGISGAAATRAAATPTTTPAATPSLAAAVPEVKPAATPTVANKPGTSGLGAVQATPGSSRAAKTVMHTPSKKPVAMDPTSEPLAPRAKQPSGPTMHAGPNTEKVSADAAAAEAAAAAAAAEAAPERRAPPHTPPVASVVSSGPSTPEPVVTTPKPEDIAAQSNSQLDKKPVEVVKPVETPTDKAPDKPVVPVETPSSKWVAIVIILLLIGVAIGLYMMYMRG